MEKGWLKAGTPWQPYLGGHWQAGAQLAQALQALPVVLPTQTAQHVGGIVLRQAGCGAHKVPHLLRVPESLSQLRVSFQQEASVSLAVAASALRLYDLQLHPK